MKLEKPQIEEFDEKSPASSGPDPAGNPIRPSNAQSANKVASVLENKTWVAKVDACRAPEDFSRLFQEIGIPGEQWKNSGWLGKKAQLSTEKGGIGMHLTGIYIPIMKRFEGFKNFVAWMEGKERPDATQVDIVTACKSPKDFLNLFDKVGIPEDKWRNCGWLLNKAKFPKEKGGIGKNLCGLVTAIIDRFGKYTLFKEWMEGRTNPKLKWNKTNIDNLDSREKFLSLFIEIGLNENQWEKPGWLETQAILSKEKGGIGMDLRVLHRLISRKFGGYKKFVSWMEGGKMPDKINGIENENTFNQNTWAGKVGACKTTGDFLNLFKEVGVPGDEWKNSQWLIKTARLSKKEGGIEKSLAELYRAIIKIKGSYKKFVAWMEGKKITDRKTWIEKVKACETPGDFLDLFRATGIPEDKWKDSGWLNSKARLPKNKGGIGKKLGGLYAAITEKFGGHKEFKAWMEDKTIPEQTWVEKTAACETPEDFLNLFREIGIPGDKWKNARWLSAGARLPKEEGGIGKTLAGLYSGIIKTKGDFKKFVAWMEGNPLPLINSPEDAADIIRSEAVRLGVPPEELLDPEKITAFIRGNPVLKEALNYFASISANRSHEA